MVAWRWGNWAVAFGSANAGNSGIKYTRREALEVGTMESKETTEGQDKESESDPLVQVLERFVQRSVQDVVDEHERRYHNSQGDEDSPS